MKALIFTIDALIALVVSAVLITHIFAAVAAQPEKSEQPALLRLASDALATLEKNGVLKEARAANNPTLLRNSLSVLPPNICWSLAVHSSQGIEPPLGAAKPCKCGSDAVVAKRSFVTEGAAPRFYIATLELCLRA